MSTLDITNVVRISIATPPAGLSDYAINNLAIFTKESPINPPSNGYATYLSPAAVAADWGSSSEVYQMANLIFSQTPNILDGNGELIIIPMDPGDTLGPKITAMANTIFFGGILWAGYAPNDAEILAAAAVVQPLKKLLFVSNYLATALNSGGLFYQINASRYTYSRCLLYTLGVTQARLMAAAYAGRAMSTNFDGSATTSTMHMKDLAGVLPDTGITQTILDLCKTIGADVYASIAGLPKVFSTGGNDFFDNVYNETWLVFALEVAGFNAIAQTSTKLPQTEPGIAVLKNAYINVLKQAVNNGFIAPGSWNSPELFGNPDSLRQNVLQLGYYIYSQPVNQQSQTARAARQAPLVQIAIKFAGAVHSSNVVVNVNP